MVTGTFVADNVGGRDAITVPGSPAGATGFIEFQIRENGGLATTRFRVSAPAAGSTPITFAAGETWPFRRLGGFKAGDTLCFIETLDVGSATFSFLGI